MRTQVGIRRGVAATAITIATTVGLVATAPGAGALPTPRAGSVTAPAAATAAGPADFATSFEAGDPQPRSRRWRRPHPAPARRT